MPEENKKKKKGLLSLPEKMGLTSGTTEKAPSRLQQMTQNYTLGQGLPNLADIAMSRRGNAELSPEGSTNRFKNRVARQSGMGREEIFNG